MTAARILRRFSHCLAATVAVSWSVPAGAEWSLSFPAVAACTVSRPELPARWHATALMMPFHQGQVDVGEFVYDGTIPAFRATVYGLESGATDLLITDGETYLLDGPHHAPTRCRALGRQLSVPSTQWLSQKAVCVGRTSLAKKQVRLWKTPGFEGRARWHWFTASTRLPSRSLFLGRTSDPAVIGDYAMTYFQSFTALAETNLAGLHDLCRAKAQRVESKATSGAPTARDLMTLRNSAAEAERGKRIAALVPGLSHNACSGKKMVRWSDRFVMTATLTPSQFNEDPYHALIYYDWNDAATQLAVMFQGTPLVMKGIVSLKKSVGYRIEKKKSGGAVCEAVFPGIVRPDWMTTAKCKCRGVIDHNPLFSAGGQTQIIACPIKDQGQRVMWNWYMADGAPVMFMEAAARGEGVMLADYHDWVPGQTGQAKDFELPNVCRPIADPGKLVPGTHTLSNSSCSDCHTTP